MTYAVYFHIHFESNCGLSCLVIAANKILKKSHMLYLTTPPHTLNPLQINYSGTIWQ